MLDEVANQHERTGAAEGGPVSRPGVSGFAADASSPGLRALTPRELEVLQMIAAGLTNAEAARRLDLTVHAIKFHLAAIYRRLGVANRTEAAVTYLQSMNGRLDPGA